MMMGIASREVEKVRSSGSGLQIQGHERERETYLAPIRQLTILSSLHLLPILYWSSHRYRTEGWTAGWG